MDIIFFGRDNSFNRAIIKFLNLDHKVIAVFWVENDRYTFKHKVKKFNKRRKKYGILKASDEVLFHAFDRLFLRKKEGNKLKEYPEYFFQKHKLDCPEYRTEKIHNKEWLDKIRELKPDLIFNVCSNTIFKPKLYNIPKYGTLVLHEGVAPEYKGLHSNLWALMNKDFDKVGYTLLKVNDEIDGGELVSQAVYKLKNDESYRMWGYISHKSIIENLDIMREDLKKYEQTNEVKKNNPARKRNYYTWIGLSNFLKLYFKNYKNN